MNTLLKTISCSIAATAIAGAAENTSLGDPHRNPQIINHLWEEDTAKAIAVSLAERDRLEALNNSHHDEETQLALQMSLTTLEDKHLDETDLALQISLTTLDDKNTWDDTWIHIKDREVKHQIKTDSALAENLDAQYDGYTQDYDPEIQRILHETAEEAYLAEKQAKELEEAIALSIKIEPAQDVEVLIKIAETIAADEKYKKITNLASFCSNFIQYKKQIRDREADIKSGTNEKSVIMMIERAKREMDRKSAALKNILNDQNQLNTLIDILKLKFTDYSRDEINDILKEIGKCRR